MVTIAVQGTATAAVPAERAAVRLVLVGEGTDRAEALDAAAAGESSLATALDDAVSAGVVRTWTADDVQTGVRHHDDVGEPLPVPMHEARVDLEVEFDRIDELGAWLARVGDDLPMNVLGVEWALTDETRAEVDRQLRAEAVADGLARAQQYAVTLGLGDIEVRADPAPDRD